MMNYTEKEQSMKTLKEVACGQTVKVKKLTGEGPVKRRIMDMGITKGVDIYVRKVAPLGDPGAHRSGNFLLPLSSRSYCISHGRA